MIADCVLGEGVVEDPDVTVLVSLGEAGSGSLVREHLLVDGKLL